MQTENNLRLDDTLHDIGVSAYTGANVRSGALGQFLQLVQSGQIKRGSYLLVESLDRLSRLQVRNALGPFIELINAGITIVTLADKQVYSDATVDENWTQLMMSLAIMSRAHEESQTKSDRLQRAAEGRRKRALAGETRFSHHMFRWLDQIEIAPDKYEYRLNKHADTVRQIYEWADAGIGQIVITRRLNEAKTPTLTGKGVWQQPTVGLILRNEAVIGTYQPVHRVNGKSQPYGEALRGYLPATINEELFWRVQKNKRVRNSAGRKGERLTNLIGPLATCAHCQGRMLIKTGGAANNPQKYIRCDNNYRGGTCTGPTGQFRYDKVESAILDHVKEFHSFSAFARENNTTGKQQLQEKIASHETTLAELERQRKNLIAVAALADRDEVRAELMRELSDRRSREDSTKAELEIFRADLMTLDSAERNANSLAERIAASARYWETGSDEKVYESRSKIAQALKQIIDFISFDMNTRCFRVIIGFGIVAYEFDKQGRMTNKFDLATSHSSIGVSPLKMEHFAQGDESRHEKLSKVMREKQKAGEAVRLDTSGQPIKMLYDYEQKSHRTNALYDAVFKKTVHLLAPERLIHRDWPIKATYEQYDNIVLPDEWVKLQDNPIEPILEDFTALMKAAIAAHSVVLVRRNADESTLIDVEIVPMKDLALTP
jgi:DNA invertase Pin-like site-specific DNA recombinase